MLIPDSESDSEDTSEEEKTMNNQATVQMDNNSYKKSPLLMQIVKIYTLQDHKLLKHYNSCTPRLSNSEPYHAYCTYMSYV